MTVHQVFLGGDLRPVGPAHSRKAGWSNPEVRYAGHLPTKHWVLPFWYDGASEEWAYYREMHGAFEKGDVVHTHALSQDTRVNALVVHNKKPAGMTDKVSGEITTPAKVKFALYDGETKVDETDEIDLSKIGRTILEFGKPTAAKNTTKKDTNDDGKLNKEDMPTTAITSLGAYLGQNGTIRMEVVEGGLDAACFSAFVDLVDFRDVRGCSCASTCCDSDYPEPTCM